MKNNAAAWFSRVVWIGIIFNLFFIASQLFAPDFVNVSVGFSPGFPTVWNRAHGMMVLALTLLYIPAAVAPLRYPGYSWMLIVSRLAAALSGHGASELVRGFGSYLASDAAFCVVQAVLLQMALPQEDKLPHNIGHLFRNTGAGLRSAYRSPVLVVASAVMLTLLLGAVWVVYDNLIRHESEIEYADAAEHYKYAAIGLGPSSRLPYWIFKVLPDVFADKLPPGPGGYASLGFITEEGHATPVGFSKRVFGYDAVEANCALCHTALYRKTADSQPVVVPGGPAHTLDLQAFQRFLYDAAADPRFNGDTLMAAIKKEHKFSWTEGLVYKYAIIPATKVALLEQKAQYARQDSRPIQGKGRTDTFNPTKFVVFHMPDDHTIGTVDLPQVWNQKPRETMWLHWDGNNDNIKERNHAAAMAVGATPKSVLPASFEKVTNYLLQLQPPAFPFPIDRAKAGRGSAVFQGACASCHAFGSKQIGQVEDIAQIGTDRHRLDSFSADLVGKFHTFTTPPFVFSAYRKTNGYSAVPIDGIWLRGPYLHNGSVPNLRELLMPEDQRTKVFYRGGDVIDPINVGFISTGPDAEKFGFKLDTSVPGNGNYGHRYGTDLPAAQKDDLLEYLKTL